MLTNPNPYERAAMPEAPIYTQRQLNAAVAAERERLTGLLFSACSLLRAAGMAAEADDLASRA